MMTVCLTKFNKTQCRVGCSAMGHVHDELGVPQRGRSTLSRVLRGGTEGCSVVPTVSRVTCSGKGSR